MNTELDKTKLVQSKKAGERKAVKKAYEEVKIYFGMKYLNYNERSLIDLAVETTSLLPPIIV